MTLLVRAPEVRAGVMRDERRQGQRCRCRSAQGHGSRLATKPAGVPLCGVAREETVQVRKENKMTSKHSPLPWSVGETPSPMIQMPGNLGYDLVCHGRAEMEGERQANIALIVRAVNCHEELLEACQLALGFCVNARQTWPDWEQHPDVGVLFAHLTQALTKAKFQT
jgi:hypothetical protein